MKPRTLPRPQRGLARAAVVLACAAAPTTASAADIPANPASFPSAFASAKAGDTIVLAGGDYGNFNGGVKPGEVTIKAAPGAAAVMELEFNGAANLTFDGLTLGDVEMTGPATRNITVRNSAINGQTVLRTGYLQNANILFDRNVHGAWDKCGDCGEGRVWLPQKTGQPSGITIQNSRFGPGGDSDGIQNGSNGTRILNNEFVGLRQGSSDVHVDSIQLYGSANTLIQGNYFHDDTVHIMAPDGGDHETIIDNVFVGAPGYRPTVQLGSHTGTRFEHNTVRHANVHMDSKGGESPSRDGVLRDNILIDGAFNTVSGSGCSNCLVQNNLMRGAVFVGGPEPASFAGHALAPGSPGRGAATDGTDQGARFGAGDPPAGGSGTPGPSAQGPAAKRRLRVRLLSGMHAIRRHGRLRLRVRARAAGTVVLVAKVRPKGRRKARAVRFRPKTLKFAKAGRRTVSLRVSRDARRRLRRWHRPQLVVRTFSDVGRRDPSGRFVLRIRRK